MKFSREVKTAILILACLCIFILGFNYLKGNSLLDKKTQLLAFYENVEGLNVGANITINGLNVGNITDIDFDENFEKIIVRFNVREDLNFSNESVAQIYETGLIGGKAIEILPVYDTSNTIEEGDVLPSEIKPGLTELLNQKIAPLQEKIDSVLISADSLLTGVNNVMNSETQNNLLQTLNGLTQSIDNINRLSSSMIRIVDANEKTFKKIMDQVETSSVNLANLTDSLSRAPLAKTIKNFEITSGELKELVRQLQNGHGTAGKLLKDDALYNELVNSSTALEALLTDLKSHPKKYVHFSIFGRKEKAKKED